MYLQLLKQCLLDNIYDSIVMGGPNVGENATKDQINNRNKLYTETFLKKWGEEMTQIFILRKKFMEIIEKKNLLTIFKSGNFRQLIIKLLN